VSERRKAAHDMIPTRVQQKVKHRNSTKVSGCHGSGDGRDKKMEHR
jgi:hypothetical protein